MILTSITISLSMKQLGLCFEMARVFIDVHMFAEGWFKSILEELRANKNVTFTYSPIPKLEGELAKVRAAVDFFKAIGNLKDSGGASRRDDAPVDEVEHHYNLLETTDCFARCPACDDPHIFAIIYVKPTKFVFSKDIRIAVCRDTINRSLDRRYCRFIVISKVTTYEAHKAKILS